MLYVLYVELKYLLIKYDYDNFNYNIKKIITDLTKFILKKINRISKKHFNKKIKR